ncbi:hypothetical protein PLCT2_02858 [Planctomycetaceae bacterium]|nr:hypothetical protein PLCT2_02858 [Planctomycetaceae bacterium]
MTLDAEFAYLFRHALLREAAYQLQMPSERAALHRLVLEVVDEILAKAPDEVRQLAALELAEHARLGSEDKALAPETRRALLLREFELLRTAAAFLRAQHQLDAASTVLSRLATHAEAGHNDRLTCETELARLRATAGHSLDAEREIRRLIPALEAQGKDREAIELRHDLVQLLASLGKVEECESAARLAIEAAQRRNDRRTKLLFEYTMLRCARLAGRWEDALGKTEECIKTAKELGDGKTCNSLLYFQSVLLSDLGRYDESLRALKRAREHAEGLGDPYLIAVLTGSEGMMLRDIGQSASGEPLLRSAVQYFSSTGYKRMESSFLAGLASVLINLKRYPEARQAAEAAQRIAADAGNLRELHAAQGMIGFAQFLTRQFQEALATMDTASATARAANDVVYAETWAGHSGLALLALGKQELSLARIREAISALVAMGRSESAQLLIKQLQGHALELNLDLPLSNLPGTLA